MLLLIYDRMWELTKKVSERLQLQRSSKSLPNNILNISILTKFTTPAWISIEIMKGSFILKFEVNQIESICQPINSYPQFYNDVDLIFNESLSKTPSNQQIGLLIIIFIENSMSQISFLNDYHIDPFNNLQMKRRYMRHKEKINEINNKSLRMDTVEQEQDRLIEAGHKSKEISRKFHQNQFKIRKGIENRRIIDQLSRIENRKQLTLETPQQFIKNKRFRQQTKEQIMRQFQINLQNRSMNEHLQEYSVNKKKYRKKVKHEIQQYERLRSHLQKFKQPQANHSRMSHRRQSKNEHKIKNKMNGESSFFTAQNTSIPQNNCMVKSRSLPPLNLLML